MDNNNEKTIYRLVNPEFDFEFMGKVYTLRKATLDKAIQYQTKLKELSGDSASDAKLISFCIYIMLKDQNSELTEEIVLNNIPADIDALEVLTILGFMSPTKLNEAKEILKKIYQKQ